jgi:segregation and condensation protein A
MAELEEIIEEHEETDLRSILGDSPDISILVVTLLALLEMARLGRIKVIQERLFGNVRIVRNGNSE